jgi:hypothetical protein
MEGADDAVREDEERLKSRQRSLYEALFQFVLIPLAGAPIFWVLNFIAHWLWVHR